MVDSAVQESLRQAVASRMPWVRDELATLVAFRSVANPAIEPAEVCGGGAAGRRLGARQRF